MTAKQAQAAWDALRRERDELAAQVEATNALLDELLNQLGERENLNGDAPGHSHEIPGVWDSDNGELAGKPCAWCATWKHAKAVRSSHNTAADILRQRDARTVRETVERLMSLERDTDSFNNSIRTAITEVQDMVYELERKNG